MEKRAIFPAIMFTFAAASFLFGGWQYMQARSVAAAAQKRMAFIVTTIEQSPVSRVQKKELYASIMGGLPAAPGIFSLDVSGSFASPAGGDSCSGEGQRAVCRALKAEQSDAAIYSAVCGACNPQ
jgi:hypothetical protein